MVLACVQFRTLLFGNERIRCGDVTIINVAIINVTM